MTSWRRPTGNSIKLNVDGATQVNASRAGVGCVARDGNSHWLVEETHSVGQVSPLTAELLSIYFGLKLVWRMNYMSVILESNSVEALSLILGKREGNVKDRALKSLLFRSKHSTPLSELFVLFKSLLLPF